MAVVESVGGKDTLLYSDCVVTDKDKDFPERMGIMAKACEKIINKWHPEGLSIEKLFFSGNQKTAMRVAEVRGMVIALAVGRKLSVREYSPQEVKIAVTGSGRASKTAVSDMVYKLIELSHTPEHDDEYDAIAVAITDIHSKRF